MAHEKINRSMLGTGIWLIYCWQYPVGFKQSWNLVSGKQIILLLSVQRHDTWVFRFTAPESLWRSGNNLGFTTLWCSASWRTVYMSGREHGETRYWKTTIHLVGHHPPHRYICPFISLLSPAVSFLPSNQRCNNVLSSLLSAVNIVKEEREGKKLQPSPALEY